MHMDRDTGMFHVTDRHRYPAEVRVWSDLDDDVLGFPFHERCVWLHFESGARLSVIWGHATWSSNRDAWLGGYSDHPTCVEVLPSWDNEPEGYVDCIRMLELIDQANNQPPTNQGENHE